MCCIFVVQICHSLCFVWTGAGCHGNKNMIQQPLVWHHIVRRTTWTYWMFMNVFIHIRCGYLNMQTSIKSHGDVKGSPPKLSLLPEERVDMVWWGVISTDTLNMRPGLPPWNRTGTDGWIFSANSKSLPSTDATDKMASTTFNCPSQKTTLATLYTNYYSHFYNVVATGFTM